MQCLGEPKHLGYSSFVPIIPNMLSEITVFQMINYLKIQFKCVMMAIIFIYVKNLSSKINIKNVFQVAPWNSHLLSDLAHYTSPVWLLLRLIFCNGPEI